eukprot:CAMPEP_0115853218 /NCGR_PEP_ID=MMETSP0287-20121206/13391_1 /TAXON_ID=412157 /ORGANISM="Chrysochromulina rotalis, Strain UIO044" /LENGTH=92 /DNA_ID=CAMNT_0003307289 /DNA_START=544 /DNA_END=822 /DNA_ORIENTATION=+
MLEDIIVLINIGVKSSAYTLENARALAVTRAIQSDWLAGRLNSRGLKNDAEADFRCMSAPLIFAWRDDSAGAPGMGDPMGMEKSGTDIARSH